MSVRRKRRGSIFVRLLVIGVSVYMVTTLAGDLKKLNEYRGEYQDLQQQYEGQKALIVELEALLEEGSETELIEKAARKMGYEYSNAVVYIDESGS